MTVKSNFKLDDRIKSIDDIQTILCNNNDFVGCKGFFFDNFVQAKNLTKHDYGTLVDIDVKNSDDHCFKARDKNGNERIGYYRFFIPEKLLKPVEKKYRPFTGIEFAEKFDLWVGHIIRIRDLFDNAGQEYEYKIMFVGYRWYKGIFEVFINGCWIDLVTLFKLYEYQEDGEWKKFGVLDEEKE